MSEKRYMVFISSTFEDLKKERRSVQDAIIQMGDFPVQMESFPAASEAQLDFIKPLIQQCDYYLLVIGGRYGSLDDDGISFTHREFRFAVEQEIPILVIVHNDRASLPVDKSERTDAGRQKLEAFIMEAEAGRMRSTWENEDQLKLRVREALDHAKKSQPRIGWLRGNTAASADLLEELNQIRRQNEKYRDEIDHFDIEISLPALPDINSELVIEFLPIEVTSGYGSPKMIGKGGAVTTTWLSAFPLFLSNLEWGIDDYNQDESYAIYEKNSLVAIGSALVQEVSDRDVSSNYSISKGTFDTLVAYYVEAGLMLEEGASQPFTELAKKLGRRHRVMAPESPHFVLSRGSTELIPLVSSLDEEIPF